MCGGGALARWRSRRAGHQGPRCWTHVRRAGVGRLRRRREERRIRLLLRPAAGLIAVCVSYATSDVVRDTQTAIKSGLRCCWRRVRFTADTTALSEAVTIDPETPTPHST